MIKVLQWLSRCARRLSKGLRAGPRGEEPLEMREAAKRSECRSLSIAEISARNVSSRNVLSQKMVLAMGLFTSHPRVSRAEVNGCIDAFFKIRVTP